MEKDIRDELKKSIFVDCCIVSNLRPLIVAEQDMGDDYDPWTELPPSHIVLHNTERQSWGLRMFAKNGFKWPRAAHSDVPGEMILVGERGEVWHHGLGENKQFESPIDKQLIRGVYAIKNISNTIYVVGTNRAVVRRDGVNSWTLISEEIKQAARTSYEEAKERGDSFHSGFDCIDGFSSDHLYAAGGNGDIWCYQNQIWHQITIPLPDMQITAICCAKDSCVYIAGRLGALLQGREDQWKIIDHASVTQDFRDIVEYQDRVYVCTEAGLYTIDDGVLNEVEFGDMKKPASLSALYANHGLLMATGSYSAHLFDGASWRELVNRWTMS